MHPRLPPLLIPLLIASMIGWIGCGKDSETTIIIGGGGGPGPINADLYEPNDSLGTCSSVVVNFLEQDLTLDTTADQDYFCFSLQIEANLTAIASFLHQDGDIDLELLDQGGIALAISSTQQDTETIRLNLMPGPYAVRVWSPAGAINRYGLELTARAALPPDGREANDDVANCTPINLPFLDPNLNLHSDVDIDYFCVSILLASQLTITVNFSHALGDIDVDLIDFNLMVVASSQTQQSPEIINVGVPPGVYFIRVWSPTMTTNTYGLDVTIR
ncbi:MAG: hypothetical protein O6952_07075 [Planctomycetota bacterium]|nr:hypothetical protein [Planctomycetota bacterium]